MIFGNAKNWILLKGIEPFEISEKLLVKFGKGSRSLHGLERQTVCITQTM
jgi:hypothetical protein